MNWWTCAAFNLGSFCSGQQLTGEKHNWLECWGYETVSILNEMSILTLLPPRLRGHHGGQQKGCKSQRIRRSARKCCGLDMMWPLRSCAHNSCLSLAWDLRPSQPGSQHHWRWSSGPAPTEVLLATESSWGRDHRSLWKMRPLAGFPCSTVSTPVNVWIALTELSGSSK